MNQHALSHLILLKLAKKPQKEVTANLECAYLDPVASLSVPECRPDLHAICVYRCLFSQQNDCVNEYVGCSVHESPTFGDCNRRDASTWEINAMKLFGNLNASSKRYTLDFGYLN